MDDKRFQEIKVMLTDFDGYEPMLEEVAKELIIALEVCKNNLSLTLDSEMDTQKRLEESDEKLVDSLAINLRLYDKLTISQDENKRLRKLCIVAGYEDLDGILKKPIKDIIWLRN